MAEDRILTHRLVDALPILTALAMALLATIIVAMLYVGREAFVPLALAILLSFVLAPLVSLLRRARVPRSAAVVLVVLLAFAAISGVGVVILNQVTQLAEDLPRYQSTMRTKIRGVREAITQAGPLGRAADIIQDLGKELEQASPLRPQSPAQDTTSRAVKEAAPPVPVQVRPPETGPIETIGGLVAPLLHPLATVGLIAIFVVFILLQREDLRNRFIRLAGAHDLQKTTAALDDAAHRLSRLYLMQLALNTAFGVMIGIGLWLIGVPSPALWGIVAGIMRFVPYIGAFIAAAFPLALAIAVDPGWTMFLWAAALFLIVEPLVGHVIEPVVAGHSTGLSPVAVIVSATFWTLLWGPIGLVLATPLTVCLVVIGRHTERLQFLDVLLGDRPALAPEQIFYQRMLAGDPSEAVAQAEEFLKERSLATYYDEVALGGLRLAHADVHRGAIDIDRQVTIRSTIEELVEDLADMDDKAAAPTSLAPTSDPEAAAAVESVAPDPMAAERPVLSADDLRPEWRSETPVLCIGGREILDTGAALMLGQLLEMHGIKARVLGPEALSAGNLFRLDPTGVEMVCLSFMDAPSSVHVRLALRRLTRKIRDVQILVGVWSERSPAEVEELRRQTSAEFLVTSLREALSIVIEQARIEHEAEPVRSAEDAPKPSLAAAG